MFAAVLIRLGTSRAACSLLVATNKVALIRMLADVFFLDAPDVGYFLLQSLELLVILLVECCLSRFETLNLSFERGRVLAQSACLLSLLFALTVAFGLAPDGCFASSLHGIC